MTRGPLERLPCFKDSFPAWPYGVSTVRLHLWRFVGGKRVVSGARPTSTLERQTRERFAADTPGPAFPHADEGHQNA